MAARALEVGITSPQAKIALPTISGVTITGTAGQFAGTLTGFLVGTQLQLSGTYGGTGSITGYVDPTTYLVSVTNGTTTFTLTTLAGAPLVTTAGTPTGITYTVIPVDPTRQIGAVGQSIQLLGFYVNSTSSGTLVFKAVNSSGTALSGTITPVVGWHRLPIDAPTGLNVTLGGLIDATFFYAPNS